jgi:hypothetical protein
MTSGLSSERDFSFDSNAAGANTDLAWIKVLDRRRLVKIIAESALRILIPRRNMRSPSRDATRLLIHRSIAQIRALSDADAEPRLPA